jgi:lipoprotein NlpD
MKPFRPVYVMLLLASLLGSCAGPPPAPSEHRSGRSGTYNSTPDGYYRVRRGDNLNAIAFKFGLDWREIARLNGISVPYLIYPDQVLQLTPPAQQAAVAAPSANQSGDSSSAQISAATSPASTTTRALESPGSSTSTVGQPLGPPTSPAPLSAPTTEPDAAAPAGTQAPAGSSYSIPAGDPGRWLWPTEGRVVSSFRANDPARKGIDIGGRAGQPVLASAAGQVVYSGSGLIGYGELIIIKHSDRMLSAYAHNSKRMVNEGQQVTAGSQIAEMGSNDRNRAVLHFEIRRNGSPVDPLRYLPQR